jgi:hypothetical protein
MQKGMHIGRTVMPSRHEIICYDCGFMFEQTGQVRSAFCPKCRKNLEVGDYNITERGWSGSITTVGKVHVRPGSSLSGGVIRAGRVIMEGDAGTADIEIGGTLELKPGYVFDPARIRTRKLFVSKDVELALDNERTYRLVEVAGRLTGEVRSEKLKVLKTGAFDGAFHGKGLIVEEGGGLTGSFYVSPEDAFSGEQDEESPPQEEDAETAPGESTD